MPLPTVTLTGTFLTGEGPATGEVALYLTSPMVDAAENTIVPVTKIVLRLDGWGKFTTTIVPSDAAGLLPNPVPYQVVERIAGGAPRLYQVLVPSASSTVDLADLAPIGTPPDPPSAYVLVSDLAAETAARQQSLAAEASTRALADVANASAVTTEAGTRATADTTNANAIAAEAASRVAGDATKVAKAGDSMTGDLAMGSHRVTGLADPSASQDAATKAWTSAQITALVNGAPGILDTLGEIATQLQADESAAAALTTALATETTNRTNADALAVKKASNGSDFADTGSTRANLRVPVLTPAQALATTNQALTGLPVLDGYQTVNGDVVLLTAQTTASQNGAWQTAASGTGAWARPTDFPSGQQIKARSCKVVGGNTYAGTDWALMSTSLVTIDTTAQIWKMVGSGAYVALPSSPVDGQKLAYSAASGLWVPVTDSTPAAAGYAMNTSGTVTAFGALVDIPSTTYAFDPNGSRELWLTASFEYQLASSSPAVGAYVGITVQEVSNGVDTPVKFSGTTPVGGTGAASTGAGLCFVPLARVGAIARTRTFKVQVARSGSTVAGNVLNTAEYPSTLRGEWR